MAMGMMRGFFGINGDGKFSCTDKVVGYGFTGRGWKKRRSAGAEHFAARAHGSHRMGWSGREEEDDIFAEVGRAVKLILAGLDEETLRDMDEFDRWEALEDAGLDPEEFDYLDI